MEEVNDDHDDDFDDNNNTDEDDDDNDGNHVPNVNKELDFSDDKEFLAELSDCSDDVIEVESKGKGVKKAKGGNQHYRNGPKPPDTSRMTEAQVEAAMNNFLRERKKWTDTQRKKRIKDGMMARDISFTGDNSSTLFGLWRKFASLHYVLVTPFK